MTVTVMDTGWATRADLEALQLEKARRLLERAAGNPFYGPRLARAGVGADALTDLGRWREGNHRRDPHVRAVRPPHQEA